MVSRLHRFAAASLAACVLVLVPTAASRACSVCQCGDPLFNSTGSSMQPAGSFSFYLEGLASTKTSGALAHDPAEPVEPGDRERAFDRDLTLWATWTPLPRITFSASVPYRWITITEKHADGDSHDHDNHGFGDAAVYLTSVLWQDLESKPMSWIDLRAMVKLPTGQSEKTVAGEEDPHLQTGTGSWDFGFGLGGGHHFEHFSLYGSGFYRWNRHGSLNYQYGDVFLGNLIATWEAFPLFGESLLIRPGAELNLRWTGRDRQFGVNYEHSGGTILYATPVVEIPFTTNADRRAPWLRLAVRFPLGDGQLHGVQHEGIVYTAGIGVQF